MMKQIYWFLQFLNKCSAVIFLFIFISTTYIIKFSIYLCVFLLSFRVIFCFTIVNYCLIRMTFPQITQDYGEFTHSVGRM
jgi:hypothetical protein